MKARNNKSRWLLISLLFGLLAAAGLILTHHAHVRFVTTASQPVPAKRVIAQLHAALLAATGRGRTLTAPVGTPRGHEPVDSAASNDPQPLVTGHSDSPSNATTLPGVGSQTVPVGGTSDGTPQSHQPATSAAGPTAPQDGQYAYNGYIPLDCGLPAGCGGVNTAYVTRQPSLTAGTVPVAHNSQGSTPGSDGPSDPGPGSDPPGPGPNPSVAAAPELDPATLAGAITLLLGALAVLRGRRVRVSRGPRSRVTR